MIGRLYRVTRGAYAGRYGRLVSLTGSTAVVMIDGRLRAAFSFAEELVPFDGALA